MKKKKKKCVSILHGMCVNITYVYVIVEFVSFPAFPYSLKENL